jgi:hypothetical protein
MSTVYFLRRTPTVEVEDLENKRDRRLHLTIVRVNEVTGAPYPSKKPARIEPRRSWFVALERGDSSPLSKVFD